MNKRLIRAGVFLIVALLAGGRYVQAHVLASETSDHPFEGTWDWVSPDKSSELVLLIHQDKGKLSGWITGTAQGSAVCSAELSGAARNHAAKIQWWIGRDINPSSRPHGTVTLVRVGETLRWEFRYEGPSEVSVPFPDKTDLKQNQAGGRLGGRVITLQDGEAIRKALEDYFVKTAPGKWGDWPDFMIKTLEPPIGPARMNPSGEIRIGLWTLMTTDRGLQASHSWMANSDSDRRFRFYLILDNKNGRWSVVDRGREEAWRAR